MRQEDDAWSVEFTIVTGILATALSIMVLNTYYRLKSVGIVQLELIESGL